MPPEDLPDSAVKILITKGDEDEPGHLADVTVRHSQSPLVVDRPSLRPDLVTVNAADNGKNGDVFKMTLTDAAARKLADDLSALLD